MMDVRLQRTARVLWGVTTIFTVYATMIPFTFVSSTDVVREHLGQALARSTISEIGQLSRADILQNVLLFVPFGLFAVASFPRARAAQSLATVVTTAAILSLMCESLQLMTVDRVSSLWDVYANVSGALFGGVLALVARELSPRVLSRPQPQALLTRSTLPLIATVALVCIAAWEPFDVTLDVGTVWSKVKPFVTGTWIGWQPVTDELLTALRFGMLALLMASGAGRGGVTPSRARRLAAGTGIVLGAALEGSQFLITSRSPSLQDVAAATTGALIGTMVWGWSAQLPRVGLLVVLTVLAAVPFYLQPFAIGAHYESMALIPFLAYYEFTTLQTVSHVIDLLLIYAPIGFAVQWDRGTSAVSIRVALVALLIAGPLELTQGWIVGRFPDVTDIAMAVLGGLIGAAGARHGMAWVAEMRNDRKWA